MLLPADIPAAADALVRQDVGQRNPLTTHLLGWLHRRRVLAALPLGRVRVSDVGATRSIADELGTVVVGEPVDVVVRLGRRRFNRPIVLRVLDRSGRTRAYAKLAVTPTGACALARERTNLDRVASLPLRLVVAPDVLHDGRWGDARMLVLSPLSGRAAHRDGAPPLAAMYELAVSGAPLRQALADTPFFRNLRQALATLPASRSRDRLSLAADQVEHLVGAVDVPTGCWHGDWVPWNSTLSGFRVLLWDWEHYAEGVPVGLDAVHYVAQHLRMSCGTGRAVERRWCRDAAELLHRHFGFDRLQTKSVLVTYLLEVNLRFLRERQDDPAGLTPRRGWGVPLVEHLVGEWLDREAI